MYLDEIVREHKQGKPAGIPSVCSAHPQVLLEALKAAQSYGVPPLIEATCNQVNQFGGYTGMTPVGFVGYLRNLADEAGFPVDDIILGGDHLGPSPWQDEPAASAMAKARQLVEDYAQAGFTKIHLDCSMRLADDPPEALDPGLSARRAAELAAVAESSAVHPLRYVIGTEVPVPGGAQEEDRHLQITTAGSAQESIEVSRRAFDDAGLASAWERVIALVVQPGVEFGDDFIAEYDPAAARQLSRFIESQSLLYEAHSTDYQPVHALRALVRDHFAILKVGPGLTFAYREAVFALAGIEDEWLPAGERSDLLSVLEAVMTADPRHWAKYYHGTPQEQAAKRMFSLSDRIRYYWPEPRVQAALAKLFQNLGSRPIPAADLRRHAPQLELPGERSEYSAAAVISAALQRVLRDYHAACMP
jgi:D-tagatose-1,6-bisphosphate aldolase subunit GatZ/KbaZ